MASLFKKLRISLLLIAILGGCTVISDGPKFIWGSNVRRKASEMGRVCLGKMEMGHIANPITWFITPPVSYWLAKPKHVNEHNHYKDIWLVQSTNVDFDEGQTFTFSVIDVNKERWAYLGDPETDKKEDVEKAFDKPDWRNLKDMKHDVWIANTIDWIKKGKPKSANYCD